MKLAKLRSQYLHKLTERFGGRSRRSNPEPEKPQEAEAPQKSLKDILPPPDQYRELAMRFFEAWQKDRQKKIKICLFGQPGAGKSSLVNELTGKKLAKVSEVTDTTQEAQIIETDDVVYVDLPGYNTARFPAHSYFSTFDPLQYDLFLCVFAGKLSDADTDFFNRLTSLGRVCIFVRNKKDGLPRNEEELADAEYAIRNDVFHKVGPQATIVFTSCRKNWGTAETRGIPELQSAIIDHLLPARRDRYVRHIKAYTEQTLLAKRRAADKLVRRYTALAAANGLNPVLGMDATIDEHILRNMYQGIRDAFSLGAWDVPPEGKAPALIRKMAGGVTGERLSKALGLLLRKKAGERAAKLLPVAGAATAMGINAGSMYYIGKQYVRTCYDFADKRLQTEIQWGAHDK
ncbi:MAG: 50S ribosome-binding GTPase [Acidaminococcus sp.]|jgi:GTP-binding protein EngB required for normal cell division|nr:50S ribosome-binding GTPase [Acidaminococcus sp.]MCI2115329.1 50S ribosome-binding GTPase [Acidaminococcus sp.]MCI2117410.1 50S ribosome-binding GTPase [Acidaminococcus sp.]